MKEEKQYVRRYLGEVDVSYEPINGVLYRLNKIKKEAEDMGYINIEVYNDHRYTLEVYGERLETQNELDYRIKQEEKAKKERFDQYQKLKEEFEG